MPKANVNGCNLHYEIRGSGDAVIFIHGEDHGIEAFDDQISRFAREYRCLTYYRRGHGKSESAAYGYSLWNQTLDLEGLLDYLGIDSVIIVSAGMGNPVAVSFALRNPTRVRALALVVWFELDGFPLLEERQPSAGGTSFIERHLMMFEVRQSEGEDGLRKFIHRESARLFPIFPADPGLRSRIAEIVASHPERHYLQAAEFYTSLPNLVPQMHQIRCPVVGICGEDDPTPDRPELLAHLPNFHQEWIPGAGRFCLMERPEAVNDTLASFFVSLPKHPSERQ